jgi:hypothetical protein
MYHKQVSPIAHLSAVNANNQMQEDQALYTSHTTSSWVTTAQHVSSQVRLQLGLTLLTHFKCQTAHKSNCTRSETDIGRCFAALQLDKAVARSAFTRHCLGDRQTEIRRSEYSPHVLLFSGMAANSKDGGCVKHDAHR